VSTPEKPKPRFYPIHSADSTVADKSPNFARTFERMSTADLVVEYDLELGGPDFRAALVNELKKRGAL
jgi:hypothetical protein